MVLSKTNTRGHCLKLFKPGHRLDCKKFALSHSVIDMWNSLSYDIVALACNSINEFKSGLDKFLNRRGSI